MRSNLTKLQNNIGYKLMNRFFDKAVVINAVDQKKRRAMSKIGAYIRRTGRRKTRPAKRTSQPGEAPKTKTKAEPNLRTILFALDHDDKTLVVGSIRMRTPYSVPELMEHGGDIVDRLTGEVKHYEERKYMGPSLEEETHNPKLMKAWEDAR